MLLRPSKFDAFYVASTLVILPCYMCNCNRRSMVTYEYSYLAFPFWPLFSCYNCTSTTLLLLLLFTDSSSWFSINCWKPFLVSPKYSSDHLKFFLNYQDFFTDLWLFSYFLCLLDFYPESSRGWCLSLISE